MRHLAIRSLRISLREFLMLTTVIALGITILNHRFGSGSHVHRLPYSSDKSKFYLQVIAADDFTPVPNVSVSMTWVGSGCDGGSHGGVVRTDRNGIAYIPSGFMPGPNQLYLNPPEDGRFRDTSFTDHHTMLTCRPDGTYYPSVFRIEVNQSEDPDFAHSIR